jgi:hypothetical protein
MIRSGRIRSTSTTSREVDLSSAFEVLTARLHRNDIWQRNLKLEHFLARNDPLARGDARRQAVEHRGLARLSSTGHHDVESRANRGVEKESSLLVERPQPHQLIEAMGA